jgi:hypothetical protein
MSTKPPRMSPTAKMGDTSSTRDAGLAGEPELILV